eukprot:791573_1
MINVLTFFPTLILSQIEPIIFIFDTRVIDNFFISIWEYFSHLMVDNVVAKASFGCAAKCTKLKTYVSERLRCYDTDAAQYAEYTVFNSHHLLNSYIVWRCIWFSILYTGTRISISKFDNPHVIALIKQQRNIQRIITNKINKGHATDIYGCHGLHNDTSKRVSMINTDGLRLLSSRVCSSFRHYRIATKCFNRPPGRGKRRYCDDPRCQKWEKYCRAFYATNKGRRFCGNKITGNDSDKCDKHVHGWEAQCDECVANIFGPKCDKHADEYDPQCTHCIHSKIPIHFFCDEHHDFQEEAVAQLQSNAVRRAMKKVSFAHSLFST